MSSIQATSCNSLTLCEPWFKLQSLFYGQRQQQYAAIISILLELLVALSSSSLRNKNGTWCPWVPFESFFTSSTFRLHVVLGATYGNPGWGHPFRSLQFGILPQQVLNTYITFLSFLATDEGGDCGEFFGWQWYVGEHRCHGYLSKSWLGWSFH